MKTTQSLQPEDVMVTLSVTRGDGTRVASPGSPYAGMRVLSERVVEKEVRVPRVIRTEEVVERLATRSEVVRREEIVEETHKVREKVTEIERPVIQETIVEVDQSDAVEESSAEASASVQRDIIIDKESEQEEDEEQEEEAEAPTVIQQERIIEVVDLEYKDVPVEKIVEVSEIYEEVVIVEKKVPQKVEREEIEYSEVLVDRRVDRAIPVPVEAVVETHFKVPPIEQVYTQVDIPVYVPRFIEVACPVELADEDLLLRMRTYNERLTGLMSRSVVSWMEVEQLASDIKSLNAGERIGKLGRSDLAETLMRFWREEKMPQYGSHRTTITPLPRSPLDPSNRQQPFAVSTAVRACGAAAEGSRWASARLVSSENK